MEYDSVLKRKDILNLENVILKDISPSQILHDSTDYEVLRAITITVTDSGTVVARGRWGSHSTGTEFQFCKMKNLMETDGDGGWYNVHYECVLYHRGVCLKMVKI